MNLSNKHIVLILIIIIVFVFIYNYDVYIVPKNEPLCKPVFVTKRELSPEERAEFNESQTVVFKETFTNLLDNDYFEGFDMTKELLPPKSIGTYSVPYLTDPNKIKVIDSVVKVLSYIPTTYSENDIKELVEYFSMIYNSADNLEIFYNNVASSTKIVQEPYNSKYSHLILFLIGKFHNDIDSCNNSDNPNSEYCPVKPSSFKMKPEDIPNIINHYHKLKELDQQDKQDQQYQEDKQYQETVIDDSSIFNPNSQKSKKSKKVKVKKSKKYLDQVMSQEISEQLNQPRTFDIENTKVIGIPNLSDGPSSTSISNSVDRDSVSTRINSTPSATYSANFAGFAHSMFKSGCSSGNCSMSNSDSDSDDYLNSPQNAYYYKATDYLNQELQPIESFNSMSSNYGSYAGSF